MGNNILKDFIYNATIKKYEFATRDEMIELLATKKLDDITLQVFAEKLNVIDLKLPNGFQFVPNQQTEKFSDQQQCLRAIVGAFVSGDIIRDTDNHMKYLYDWDVIQKRYGFNGNFDMQIWQRNGQKQTVDVTVPYELFGQKVTGLINGFKNTSNININLYINAQDVAINNMFENAGITNMINFSKIRPYMLMQNNNGIPFALQIDPIRMMKALSNMPNLSMQNVFEFAGTFAGRNMQTLNELIANEFWHQGFEIKKMPYELSQEEKEDIRNILSFYQDGKTREEKIAMLARLTQTDIPCPGITRQLMHKLHVELGRPKIDDVIIAHIKSLKPEDIRAFPHEYGNGIYEIITKTGINVIYDADTKTLTKHYNEYDMDTHLLPKEEVEKLLSNMQDNVKVVSEKINTFLPEER